ncbi:hypothetical protein GIB67_018495 [Kingdonia uniflora]|uniref:Uncharacterized protein n=1 Tax=Kingdonia uniflora TaxID=39325 RepID=A0A7J7LWA5_9MAGN|nr:hypothetical protein GIB67_018495 [Kingdonia uniflora]
MGKYTTRRELKPPIPACVHGSGKHPQLMPSTPRWAVANGAGVILTAVPALLLPPPTTALDEYLVAGLPALEPYARLFHRYYAIATPSITQKLLLGLLEAPPSWASDAFDAAVQLVELLRAAEDYASGMRLPRNWMHLHFLRVIGTVMSMRVGIAADTAAVLLFRILQLQTQSSTLASDKKLDFIFKAVLAQTQYSTSSFQQYQTSNKVHIIGTGVLRHGKSAHGQTIRINFKLYTHVANAIILMYSKYGNVEEAFYNVELSSTIEYWLIIVKFGEYDTTITPFSTEVLVVVSRRKLESEEVAEYSQKSAYVITELKDAGYKYEVYGRWMVDGGVLWNEGNNCCCSSLKWLDTISKEEICVLNKREGYMSYMETRCSAFDDRYESVCATIGRRYRVGSSSVDTGVGEQFRVVPSVHKVSEEEVMETGVDHEPQASDREGSGDGEEDVEEDEEPCYGEGLKTKEIRKFKKKYGISGDVRLEKYQYEMIDQDIPLDGILVHRE